MRPVVADAVVLKNLQEGPGGFRLWLAEPGIASAARPGQFVNLRAGDGVTPLLRRPFSFCDIRAAAGHFSILYQVVGPGTAALSRLKPGDQLSTMGPLGNGFDLSGPRALSILCAGGIGVAPFPAVARELASRSRLKVVLGARTAALCLCQEDFAALGISCLLATEDGSAGHRGFVTGPLRQVLAESPPHDATVYACGPEPMLAAVAEVCQEYRVPAQLSVEAVMGCGVGACLSCVFRIPDGRFIRSCVEGPVFQPGDVLF